VKVNGRAIEASATPGSYLTLTRTWKTGDRVEMALPMRLTIEAMPDEPQTQAVLYGPLVLAGDLGGDGLTDQSTSGPMGPRVNRATLDIPAIHAPSADPASWLKPVGKPLTFRTTGQTKDLDMAPLNSIYGKRYVVYWQVA
jgi:DUF1680 family protein